MRKDIDINDAIDQKALVVNVADQLKIEDAAHRHEMEKAEQQQKLELAKNDQQQHHRLEMLTFGGIFAVLLICLFLRTWHADQDTKFYDTAISSIITALLAYFAGKSGKR